MEAIFFLVSLLTGENTHKYATPKKIKIKNKNKIKKENYFWISRKNYDSIIYYYFITFHHFITSN